MASQTFEEQYENMVKKQLSQMVQAYLDAQVSAKNMMKKPPQTISQTSDQASTDDTKNSRTAAVAAQGPGGGGTETKDYNSHRRRNHSNEDKNSVKNDILPSMDIDSINKIELPPVESNHLRAAVPAEVVRAQHLDRARRSISVEARQANLIDQIAQFNDIPKKYEIKFDLTGVQQQQQIMMTTSQSEEEQMAEERNKSEGRQVAQADPDDERDKGQSSIGVLLFGDYKTTWSDIECAPTIVNEQNQNEAEVSDNLIVKATQSLFVREGNFNRKVVKSSQGFLDKNGQSNETTVYLIDYSGRSKSAASIEQKEVIKGFDESDESERAKGEKNVEHIFNRLIDMLVSSTAAFDDQLDDIYSYQQLDHDLEDGKILRTSGQAKSVRCLSSQMRQANQYKIQNQKYQQLYHEQAAAQQQKQQQSAASWVRRQTQGYEQTNQPLPAKFNHQKNQSSLATPVIRGLKSAEIDAQQENGLDVAPFEYGITEDNRRQETDTSGKFDLNFKEREGSSQERVQVLNNRRASVYSYEGAVTGDQFNNQAVQKSSKETEQHHNNNNNKHKITQSNMAKHHNKSGAVQRNLRMSLTSNHLKESSGSNNNNNQNFAVVSGATAPKTNKMQNGSRTTALYAKKDKQSVTQNPQTQQAQQPILSSGSSQRSINFASCLSHRSQSNKQKLLVHNNQQTQQQQAPPPVQQKFIQQQNNKKHQKSNVHSPSKKNVSINNQQNSMTCASTKLKTPSQQQQPAGQAQNQHMQTHAGGFMRSTTITTGCSADANGKKVQFPHITKKDSTKQLLYPVAKRGSGAHHHMLNATASVTGGNRIRSEQRQSGVTRTNTTLFSNILTQSSFQQPPQLQYHQQNNQPLLHGAGQSIKTSSQHHQHIRKNLSSQPKVMTVGQVLLEQHQQSQKDYQQHQQLSGGNRRKIQQQKTSQLPTITQLQQQQQTTSSSAASGCGAAASGNFNTIRPQLLKQNHNNCTTTTNQSLGGKGNHNTNNNTNNNLTKSNNSSQTMTHIQNNQKTTTQQQTTSQQRATTTGITTGSQAGIFETSQHQAAPPSMSTTTSNLQNQASSNQPHQPQTSILQTVQQQQLQQQQQQQQQQQRLTSMNHHQHATSHNSQHHSTRPARIYTAKLTSGNLKQFFFNNNNTTNASSNNNNTNMSTGLPSGKQYKHKNYSPKASNQLKQQRQNNLLISNEHGYMPNAQQMLQSASSQIQQQQSSESNGTTGLAPSSKAGSYQQYQASKQQQPHRSYLMQLSSKKAPPNSGGHLSHPCSAAPIVAATTSNIKHQLASTNASYHQHNQNNSILSSHIHHSLAQGAGPINSMRPSNIHNQFHQESSQHQITMIHYSSSQTQLQQMSSSHQEFGGLLADVPQHSDNINGLFGGAHHEATGVSGTTSIMHQNQIARAGRIVSGITATSPSGHRHNAATSKMMQTRNTMQAPQQNRKMVINTTSGSSNVNSSTQPQHQQSQQYTGSGNPRRTLYSAKHVSQVYRPSQIQYQQYSNTNNNSSAKKKKAATANASGQTQQMAQQAQHNQHRLMMQSSNAVNKTTINTSTQQTGKGQHLHNHTNNQPTQQQHTSNQLNQSGSKTGGSMNIITNTPSQQLHHTSSKVTSVMRQSQMMLMSSNATNSNSNHHNNVVQNHLVVNDDDNDDSDHGALGLGNHQHQQHHQPSPQGVLYLQQHESMVKLSQNQNKQTTIGGGSPRYMHFSQGNHRTQQQQLQQQKWSQQQQQLPSSSQPPLNQMGNMTPDLSHKIIDHTIQKRSSLNTNTTNTAINEELVMRSNSGLQLILTNQQQQQQQQHPMNEENNQHVVHHQAPQLQHKQIISTNRTAAAVIAPQASNKNKHHRKASNQNQSAISKSTIPSSRIHSTLAQYNNKLMNYESNNQKQTTTTSTKLQQQIIQTKHHHHYNNNNSNTQPN